ncbi:PRA1 family protein H [Juglans microcarpa x Juglans regia]|uniref:PRA1 family protein H n=1 Tax=Juglans microcarpa x Juglans regia TaxID=2249226 RepID=UPI001B7DE5A5|nr:PRA1 family protein H [Juglans microcarpa x Juglans regia]
MAFSSNPLSLSVPEPAFESWLRDSGYLEILDHRTSSIPNTYSDPSTTTSTNSTITSGLISLLLTLLSLFTFNPFSKLTTEDFSGQTPSWSYGFVGFCDSYSFPSSPAQARLRVHENVKRYARNYATLFILFFACTLYQMPLALIGLLSCLALWDVFKFCSDRWGLDHYPVIQQCLVRIAQCVAAVIVICSNVQMALFCALGVSYTGMILHSAFRKLTPAKQPPRGRSAR